MIKSDDSVIRDLVLRHVHLNCDSVEMAVVDTWGYDASTGMFGYLHRGDADIGTTPMFVIEERLSVVTYIAGTTRSRRVGTDAI
jgi:hypothetical protein